MVDSPKVQKPGSYHVRCLGSATVRQALQSEQARRMLQTGQKVNVMDIASEWLEEKAQALTS